MKKTTAVLAACGVWIPMLLSPAHAGPVTTERFLSVETVRLWPGSAPGAKGDAPADIPSVTVFEPHFGRVNGTAVIVAPGGGYTALASNLEGRQVADWFAARGVTAFVLNYRLGARYPFPTALIDAQRAIRFIRANAKHWNLSSKVGMIGFSAGGHLTAMAGTSFTPPNASAADPVDRFSDRPDFLVLGYPAIAFMEPLADGSSTYCKFVAMPDCDPREYARFVPDTLVRADTPPAFLYHTSEDELTAENSVRFYRALRAKGVPAELHIFGKGPHGTGLGDGDPQLDIWPMLLEGWLRQQDFLPRSAKPAYPIAADDGPLSLQASFGRLLHDPRARALLEKHIGRDILAHPGVEQVSAVPAEKILAMFLSITDEQMRALDRALRALPPR